MNFGDYQGEVVRRLTANLSAHEVVPMLGIGGHSGKLLVAQQRYLTEELVAQTNTKSIGRELGMVLRSAATLSHLNTSDLGALACENLAKVDARARGLGFPGVEGLTEGNDIDADRYQELSSQTDQEISYGTDPLSLTVPMLGLAGEAGNLLVEMKKRFRGDSEIADWTKFVEEEIGDLLWYVAASARHVGLRLSEILQDDVTRIVRSTTRLDEILDEGSFDAAFPDTERLPRRLQVHFQDRVYEGKPTVGLTLLDAYPNPFPNGPVPRGPDKFQGFKVGDPLGDEVNDNSRRADAYRYHDAIHLGFLAIIGWSPNLRNLLQVKRKSDPLVDDAEDGARAIFAEEGLAAILAKQASASQNFETPGLVPEELLELIEAVVDDLEVGGSPFILWREAISQGFTVMRKLRDNGGGYVLADLDKRSLQYAKFPFPAFRTTTTDKGR